MIKKLNRYVFGGVDHQYPPRVLKLKEALEEFFQKHKYLEIAGDAFFCAPNVWKARGERHATGADLIFCIGSSHMYRMVNCGESQDLFREFRGICEAHGYYYELGEAWYLAFYPAS